MTRRTPRVVWFSALLASAGAVAPQPLDAQKVGPAFDVVSIKVNRNSTATASTRDRPDGGFTMIAETAVRLLARAFGDTRGDMVGTPQWAFQTRLDVIATAVQGRGTATGEQRRNMTRAMLAERFKLQWHLGTRQVPVFDLVYARRDRRLGKGLKKSTTDCDTMVAQRNAERAAALAAGKPYQPVTSPSSGPLPPCTFRPVGTRIEGEIPMMTLPVILRGLAGRPVVDKTGLKGSFHLTLDAVPGVLATPSATTVSEVPSVFTAVEEQLGLKLVPSRAVLPALFIDRFEPPSEN
jgi:uncharacterized protein (TIGR03435 family)